LGSGPAVDERFYERHLLAESLQRHFLPDGSLIEMRAGSEAEARFDAKERHVILLVGESHFSVAKNEERPFVVTADEARFEAVGTAFSVRLAEDEVNLLVTEGRVRVSPQPLQAEPTPAASVPAPPGKELAANQLAIIERKRQMAIPAVKQVSETELEERLSWKREILDFEATPLSAVVAAFNERNRDQLVLADEELGDMMIDGSFRSDNLPAFVRLIELTAGLKADRSQAERIVLSRPER